MKSRSLHPYLWSLQILALLLIAVPSLFAEETNALKLSVAFVGDGQIGYSSWQATKDVNPSSMNIPHIAQTMADLRGIKKPASMLVFLGDLVMAEGDDHGEGLQVQLNAWQVLYQAMTKRPATKLMPVAGNHELNIYRSSVRGQGPSTYAYNVWLDWITRNKYTRYTGNGPKPTGGNPDMLARDESQMTFSFNHSGVHFLVINTDTLSTQISPTTGMPYAGWIPINWIERDLAKAQKNQGVKAIIVMGHRPIEGPSYDKPEWGTTILNTTDYPLANRLSEALRKHRKVRAYLTSHTHSWHSFRLAGGKGPYQIIAGNAGAELDTDWNPQGGPYFGYSVLDIYANGRMEVRNYGRALPPAPQKFFEDTPVAPESATLEQRLVIARH